MNWQPGISRQVLERRAQFLASIRQFFKERDILEVETPLLSHSTNPHPFVPSLIAEYQPHPDVPPTACYLQTSPEFAMKRLLAMGSGSIYQLCKAFRNDFCGKLHNPEFTMLEWYHVGYDHHQLMDEVDAFLKCMLHVPPAERVSYQALFQQHLNTDPLTVETAELKKIIEQQGIEVAIADSELDKDGWLNLAMSHLIEPKLGKTRPVFVYDYPASQAALAKISSHDARLAERFEVYYQGIELGNGFHELSNENEQRKRFKQQLKERERQELPIVPLDENFLKALEHGLPDCAGIAIGIDRLLMIALKKWNIRDVMGFDFDRS